jgi:hypothetical protein
MTNNGDVLCKEFAIGVGGNMDFSYKIFFVQLNEMELNQKCHWFCKLFLSNCVSCTLAQFIP